MSPALSRSTALQRFKCGNAVEIRNRMMFNFYLALPHDSETEISSGYEILYALFNYNFMYKHLIGFTSLYEGSEMHLQQVTTHHMLTLIGGMR